MDLKTLVRRTGKIFESGDYPDKDFKISDAEMDAAIAGFTPVPINIEHRDTIFDGQLGTVAAIKREGPSLYGEIEIPAWLDELNKGKPLKVSAEWDSKTKAFRGLGLVINPRIADAAVYAAFSAEDLTKAERDAIPEEDFAGPNRTFPIRNQKEVDAASHLYGRAEDPDAVKAKIIEIATRKGLTLPDGWDAKNGGRKTMAMSTIEALTGAVRGLLSKSKPEDAAAFAEALLDKPEGATPELTKMTATLKSPQSTPAEDELKAKFARIESENKRLALELLSQKAEAFASKLQADGKILPVDKPGVVKTFSALAILEGGDVATFSESGDGLKGFIELMDSRPQTHYDTEVFTMFEGKKSSSGEGEKLSDEDLKKLLEKHPAMIAKKQQDAVRGDK